MPAKKIIAAALAMILVDFLYLYFYIFLGLGGTLKGWPELALALGASLSLLAFALFLLRFPRLALGIGGLSVAVLVGIIAYASQSHKAKAISFAEFNRAYNKRILEKSLARLKCSNGDTAVIYPSEDFVRKKRFLGFAIIPANPDSSILPVITSSQRNPKTEEGILKDYLSRKRTKCENSEHNSLQKFWSSLDSLEKN